MIAMVDPVSYNSNTYKDTYDSFDCELQKNLQFAIIRISQSKPELWYVHRLWYLLVSREES